MLRVSDARIGTREATPQAADASLGRAEKGRALGGTAEVQIGARARALGRHQHRLLVRPGRVEAVLAWAGAKALAQAARRHIRVEPVWPSRRPSVAAVDRARPGVVVVLHLRRGAFLTLKGGGAFSGLELAQPGVGRVEHAGDHRAVVVRLDPLLAQHRRPRDEPAVGATLEHELTRRDATSSAQRTRAKTSAAA